MRTTWDQITQLIGAYIPNLLGALLLLVGGWFVALLAATAVRGGVRRTGAGKRLAQWIVGEEARAGEVEEWIGKGVQYLIMLFVLVGFFQALGLHLLTEPLNRLLGQLFQFAPQLFGAGLLLLIAWIVASVLRLLLTRVLTAARVDERLGDQVGFEPERRVPLTQSLADAVYWLVFLLFLPAVLGALALEGILEPVRDMMNQILRFLPNLFAAGLILGVGWFLARIVQRIVTNLLAAIGADHLSERVGLAPVLGAQRLSGVLGQVIYILILIPVLIAALNGLALEAITRPASNMLNVILEAIPAIFAAGLLVGLAYVVGRVVSGLITNLLRGVGFDTLLARVGLAPETTEERRMPSAIVGYLVMVTVMLFATIEAFRLIGFETVGDLVAQFMVFAGHVLLGLVIFAIGLYLAHVASKTVLASGVAQAALLAMAARVSIIILAGAMALRQMGLANEIINLTFGLLLGAVAVAIAIAFGLGGRDIAARQLGEWVQKVRAKKS
ncbi:MAG: mechanosensitive ion channel [Candidatus Methylomirabilales bacterium]